MDVVKRNLLRLLRTSLWGDNQTMAPSQTDKNNDTDNSYAFDPHIEPMSEFKWNQLIRLAQLHQIGALVANGIRKRNSEFLLNIPDKTKSLCDKIISDTEDRHLLFYSNTAQLLDILNQQHLRPILLKGLAAAAFYPNPELRLTDNQDILFPFPTQANKANKWARITIGQTTQDNGKLKYSWNQMPVNHLTTLTELANPVYNAKLQNIINDELRCLDSNYLFIKDTKIEILPPTLAVFASVIKNVRIILNQGLILKQLTDLATLIKANKNKIDQNKLNSWITATKLDGFALIIAGLLKYTLMIGDNEIPFTKPKGHLNTDETLNNALLAWDNYMNNKPYRNTKKQLAFLKYQPAETASNILSSITRSIYHIEE